MIRSDFRGRWATRRVGGATFDRLVWVWDDKFGLKEQLGYMEDR